jgi:hypothetical protein
MPDPPIGTATHLLQVTLGERFVLFELADSIEIVVWYCLIPPPTRPHTYTRTQTYVHMHAHTHRHTQAYTHTHTHTHRHTHMLTHAHRHTHAYTHPTLCMYLSLPFTDIKIVHTHTHTHTHTLACVCWPLTEAMGRVCVGRACFHRRARRRFRSWPRRPPTWRRHVGASLPKWIALPLIFSSCLRLCICVCLRLCWGNEGPRWRVPAA